MMTEKELKATLERRRKDLKMSYRDVKDRTKIGYNTVRRVFQNPFNCHFNSVLIICETMGCAMLFTVENDIGDEIESGKQPPLEEVLQELKERQHGPVVE